MKAKHITITNQTDELVRQCGTFQETYDTVILKLAKFYIQEFEKRECEELNSF